MFRSLDKGQSAPPCLPPMGAALLLRALLKRPRPPRTAPPPLASSFLAGAPDPREVGRYAAALGFAPGATPLTWYYLVVQRAHLFTMLDPAFPYRIAGMVHVENALALHGAPADGPIRLDTGIEVLPPSASGAIYCVLDTEGRCGDTLLFTCTSKYLARRGQRGGRSGPDGRPAPAWAGTPLADWTLARSAGRAYARVSGDWNPIHLAGWSARLMGLRAPIIHGMHSVGTACARIEQASARRVRAISVRFLSPVPLGATVVLVRGEEAGSYALHCAGQLAAEGRYTLA